MTWEETLLPPAEAAQIMYGNLSDTPIIGDLDPLAKALCRAQARRTWLLTNECPRMEGCDVMEVRAETAEQEVRRLKSFIRNSLKPASDNYWTRKRYNELLTSTEGQS